MEEPKNLKTQFNSDLHITTNNLEKIQKGDLKFTIKQPIFTGHIFLQDILRPMDKKLNIKIKNKNKGPFKGGGYKRIKRTKK